MSDLLPFIVIGITTGSVYGLAGVGLVLTYKTSGIFNFAHGALATMAAYLFYFLHVQHRLAWPLAAILSAFVLGTALGLGFETLARGLSRAALAARIVATVGILLVVESTFTILYGTNARSYPHFLPVSTFRVAGTNVTWEQLIIVLISVVATAGLWIFFRTARLGKAMRAVVDDPDLLDLAGTSPTAVRRWAWVIGCTFATVSGLLLAPSVNLSATVLTLLVVQAFGAAAIGGFSSLPLTWTGGLVIGLAASIATKYVSSTSILGGLPPSIPFIILFLVLLLSPRARLAAKQVTLVRRPIAWRAPGRVQLGGAAVVAAFLLVVSNFVGFHLGEWTTMLSYVVLFLSLGLLARTSGQVSLCHAAFAAIGAVAFSKLEVGAGIPWLPSLLIAGLVAVPIGALLAIPAIRLSGLYLALATFGFGILLQDMFYNSSVMFGTSDLGLKMPLPHLGWITLDTDTGFYYVVLAITALVAVAIVVLTRSRLGRLLRGLADSPTALATNGTSVNVTRVLVFCVSAYLAAIAGALAGMSATAALGTSYDPFSSLTFMALILISLGGAPWYALLAGAGLGLVPAYLTSSNTTNYLQIIFGISAVAVALGLQPSVPSRVRSWLDRIGGRVAGGGLAGLTAKRDAQVTPEPLVAAAGTEGKDVARTEAAPSMRLEIRGLTVRFGGLVAVNNLDLAAATGRITGLIGPNGAGKTTTFNACCGLNRPTSGTVLLNGTDVSRVGPAGRARRGIGRTFQQMELFESLSVIDNVSLGREASLAGARVVSQIVASRPNRRLIDRSVVEAVELCGLQPLADRQVASLSTGQRRLVELARCLAGPFSLLLLDEPSSGLDHRETEQFGHILRRVVRERGVGILLVEHDMALVMDVCEEIFVLDFGSLIFQGSPEQVRASKAVQAAYLGQAEVSEGMPAPADEVRAVNPQ